MSHTRYKVENLQRFTGPGAEALRPVWHSKHWDYQKHCHQTEDDRYCGQAECGLGPWTAGMSAVCPDACDNGCHQDGAGEGRDDQAGLGLLLLGSSALEDAE